jgi:hypothetical protein
MYTQTHTDIRASSGFRTHDPSVRASEDCSCFRERGHCDRHFVCYGNPKLRNDNDNVMANNLYFVYSVS